MGKPGCGKASKTSGANSSHQNTEPDTETRSIQMELELLALKSKNIILTKENAKLNHEYYVLRNEYIDLKNTYITLQYQHKTQGCAYKNMIATLKSCTPSFMEILNLLVTVNENKENSLALSPRSKTVTQPVKPHTVNGTVLMNPTISLTRMSEGGNESICENLPSTSSGRRECRPFIRSIVPDNDDDDETSFDMDEGDLDQIGTIREKSASHLDGSLNRNDSNPESPEMEDSDGEEHEPEEKQSTPSRGLSTILEESGRSSFGEVRICLSRLSDQDLELIGTHNNTRTSIEASVADNTYLNIETTLIENQSMMGGRLRTDITLFSPRGNSTRLGTMSPYAEKNVGELEVTSSEIQSSIVTPSVGNDASSPMFEHQIPTPSMSVLGDIDKGASRLAILSEEQDELSPITASPVLSTRRVRGKSAKRQTADSSPLSARSSNVSRTSRLNFIYDRRGDSTELNKTPTVVLEKLEHMHTTLASAARVLPNVEEEENEKPKAKPKPKSKRNNSKASKSQSRSPNVPAKRPKVDYEEIRDIQIRLSKVVSPDSSGQPEEKPEINERSQRPHRAARPQNLKDLSLKCKMRRMF